MRELGELRDVEEPAWPAVERAIAEAGVPVRVLPTDAATAERTLVGLQVTTGSVLGALADQAAPEAPPRRRFGLGRRGRER